jgi:hypothetical protein
MCIEDLPMTIRDAIRVTRRLGFRYLWIDALCTLQDDEADKLAQISKMGDIYRHAILTIAASTSDNVQSGFLGASPMHHGCRLPVCLSDGSDGEIGFIVRQAPIWEGKPLSTPAWILQEFLLSPRILLYGEGEVRWQCQTEHLKPLVESHIYYTPPFQRLPNEVFRRSRTSAAKLRTPQAEIWGSLIVEYSQRKLTIPEDRLPAILGIAKELERTWEDQFLAGMRKSSLVNHLGW